METLQIQIPEAATIRERWEALEQCILSPFAAKSTESQGREVFEPPCPLRTLYQQDRDRIVHSKSFRRLKHKTQVFISPQGDHYRTRLTHTLEVCQVSRTIARGLRLNEDLTEAIAVGHDLGHPPFGHLGEGALSDLMDGGYRHNDQSVRVAQVIEKLNLSQETLDGIANHTGATKPRTLEGQIVKIADRMAYLNHDIEDAVRAGIIRESDIPADIAEVVGAHKSQRLERMITDMIQASWELPEIRQSDAMKSVMNELRKWMFKHVYLIPEQRAQQKKVNRVITALFDYFVHNPQALGNGIPVEADPRRMALDYVAGMTDRFALDLFNKLMLPASPLPRAPFTDEEED